jgi:hypothetical protein
MQALNMIDPNYNLDPHLLNNSQHSGNPQSSNRKLRKKNPYKNENAVIILLGFCLAQGCPKRFDEAVGLLKKTKENFELTNYKESLRRTDEKLRNLLDIALQAAFVLDDLDLCEVIYRFSIENTFVLKLKEEVLQLLTNDCLNSSTPDFSLIKFVVKNKIPIIVKDPKRK